MDTEQPSNENQEQDLSLTRNAQDAQNTEQTRKTNTTDLTREFLATLGIQSDASAAGGFGDCFARAEARASQSALGLAGVTVGDGTPRSLNSQQAGTEAISSQSVSRSREVDCRPCNGCCGGHRWRRLPGRVYDFVAWVAGVRGVRLCDVVNEFPELFCQGVGRGRGHGLGRVKELERLLSREAQYKSSYLIKRLGECSSDVVCAHYVRLGVEGWLRLWFYLNNRASGEGVVEAYLGRIAKSLGFNGIIGLARYLRLVIQGLIIEYPTDRHAGYKDVLEVGCGLCGVSFRTTVGLPAFIVNLVRHFQVMHGLRTVGDVKAKVEELMVKELDRKDKPKAHPVLRELVTEKLINTFADILVAVGLLEEADGGRLRCVLDGVEVDGAPEAVVHVLEHHHDVARDVKHLLEARGDYGGEGVE